jgi:hypothetical protein
VCLSFGAKKGIDERRWRERVGETCAGGGVVDIAGGGTGG